MIRCVVQRRAMEDDIPITDDVEVHPSLLFDGNASAQNLNESDDMDIEMNPPLSMNTSTPRNSESDLSNMLHSIRPFPSNTVPPTTGKRRGRKPGKPEILTSDESMTEIAAAEEKKNSKLAKVKQGKVAKPTKKAPVKRTTKPKEPKAGSSKPARVSDRRHTTTTPRTYYESSESDIEID